MARDEPLVARHPKSVTRHPKLVTREREWLAREPSLFSRYGKPLVRDQVCVTRHRTELTVPDDAVSSDAKVRAAMNVRLVHEFRFESAHRLPKVPPGHKCARLHGHSFKVELAIAGPVNPDTGWFIDFGDVFDVWKPLHDVLDHNYLNEIPGLENPTSEVLSKWIWDRLRPKLPSLVQVTLFETCDARCEYTGT